MANPDHVESVTSGAAALSRWRAENPDTRLNLREADLRFAALRSIDLAGADFSGAQLAGADLSDANLFAADFSHADLTDARLRYANLDRASFSKALLSRADLEGSSVKHCSVDHAVIGQTGLRSLDLREVKGLETVRHVSWSDLGPTGAVGTIHQSQGEIPTSFLKGCGLQDWEILAISLHRPDLRPDEVVDITYQIADLRTHAPIVPLSVFISYSRADQEFVELIEERFEYDGIRSWRDLHDMVAGPIDVQVDRAISLSRSVLLVLSERSVGSDWIQWELERARQLERDLSLRDGKPWPKYLLCPVALDDSWKSAQLPGSVRSYIEKYNILSFQDWTDEEVFELQYEKLKKGLGIYYSGP